MKHVIFATTLMIFALVGTAAADVHDDGVLRPIDVFQLEYAADPQISPDGTHVVYVRTSMDIMSDRRRSNLWIISADGSDHRPLTTGNENHHSPRWSPEGDRLLYLSGEEHSALVRIPGAGHGIAKRPSQLIAKVAHILKWFEMYRQPED